MGNISSLFESAPEEHMASYAIQLEQQRPVVVWPPTADALPGHVRVEFYAHRFKVRHKLRADISSTIRVEPSGDLSLFALRKLWGLETCMIIDPDNLQLGFPHDPNVLPANVVQELICRHGCIKVIEPYVSADTLAYRQLRQIAMALCSVVFSWLTLVRLDFEKDQKLLARHFSGYIQQPFNPERTRLEFLRAIGWSIGAAELLSMFISVREDGWLVICWSVVVTSAFIAGCSEHFYNLKHDVLIPTLC
ncbi:unnamed protein product [Mycena citricolor]|uniref:Uncharacterized protein n=1 Tax=Mycena citricolor TaxID=2018698 RepID=A0AAD2HDY0_9AGAR|nr:unnamed protein product [Mycena citricolor]